MPKKNKKTKTKNKKKFKLISLVNKYYLNVILI